MPEEPRYPLHEAAASGDIAAVRRLLAEGVDVNSMAGDGSMALMEAASCGNADMLRLLLVNGADPNLIVRARSFETISVDIAPLDFAPRRANTLARALISRDTETILALLEAGADVGSHPSLGSVTPLQFAVAFCDVNVVRALIQHGASLVRVDEREQTMLGLAVERDRLYVARVLLEAGAPPDGVALSDALRRGQVEMARLLFEFGADPDEVLWGVMPLRRFARGNTQLLALFPEPTAETPERMPVRAAPRGDWPQIDDALTVTKAVSEFVEAAQSGDHAALKALLDAGSDVNSQELDGTTALMAAVQRQDADIAHMLLNRGADPNMRAENGSHALYIAVEVTGESANMGLIELLLDHGADINLPGQSDMPLLGIVYAGNPTLLRFLLKRGADPNCSLGTDFPLLNLAIAQRVPFSTITLLLESGANIESSSDYGWTPLMDAAMISRKGPRHERESNLTPHARCLVQMLIAWGANVNARSQTATVVEHAAEAGDAEIVRLLLDAGADVSYGGNLNALMRAELSGHPDVAALLRERGAAEPAGNAEHDGIPDDFLPELRWRFGQLRVRRGDPHPFQSDSAEEVKNVSYV